MFSIFLNAARESFWNLFDNHEQHIKRCMVPERMLPIDDLLIDDHRHSHIHVRVSESCELLLFMNLFSVFFERSIMILLGEKVCKLERGKSVGEINFLLHRRAHIRVIIMCRITFAWFNKRGWNENVTLSQMMIEEELNFVMEKVEDYTSNIDDKRIQRRIS